MALDASDWTVSTGGDIRWTGAGTASNVTVLEMHRFLQDLADDAVASGDDLLDITDDTPSDRATDNIISLLLPYNIDDTAAEHIFDGSVSQDGGATLYSGLVVVGSVEAGTELQLVQDNELLTSYWGAGLNTDPAANILLRIMVKTRSGGVDIDGKRVRVRAAELGDTYAEFSATLGSGNSTAAIFTGVDLNNPTGAAALANYDQFNNVEGYQQIDINADGSDEDYYAKWSIGGGTTPALPTINDLYEYTKYIQRRGSATTVYGIAGELFRGVTAQWGYDAETGAAPATTDKHSWGTFLDLGTISSGPYTVGEIVTGSVSGAKGRVLSADASNESLVVYTESGTWQISETVTGASSGASATTSASPVGQAVGGGESLLLAVDDNGSDGTFWVQLLRGNNPANDVVLYKSADHTATVTVDGAVTGRTLPPALLGASTGSSVIGGFGVGIEPTALTAQDQLFDLTNTLRVPPNNVTFVVSGLVSGEDRVLVGPALGDSLKTDQFTTVSALTTNNVTSVQLNSSIPTDTPSAGTIRLFDNDGIARRLEYSSYTGDTFTISTTNGNEDFGTVNADAGSNVFISYIDKLAGGTSESFTGVYLSDRSLFIRVRDGGGTPIKTFETTGTLGSAGGSSTAIRTSDA